MTRLKQIVETRSIYYQICTRKFGAKPILIATEGSIRKALCRMDKINEIAPQLEPFLKRVQTVEYREVPL